jgi:hypothetical protein
VAAPFAGVRLPRPMARTRPPMVGSATGGDGGADLGGSGGSSARQWSLCAVVAALRGGGGLRRWVHAPWWAGDAMVAPLGPWRDNMVVRRPLAMSREVWRRGGIRLICECARLWVLHSC